MTQTLTMQKKQLSRLMELCVLKYGFTKNITMKIQPNNVKYKKFKKGTLKKIEFKSTKLTFGKIGLKACESGIVKTKQIEAARQAITRKIKRKGKLWIKIFPYLNVTSKSTGVRMGKGKGQVSYWIAKVTKGNIIFELCGPGITLSKAALQLGKYKLPIKTKIVTLDF
uniref:ribosomal protein L16 n=1 Tax=Cocconeiopsis kantsiensis TaxID=3082010 RepID=UPI003001A60E